MNIIANIPGAIKMLSCLRHLQPDKKHIEAARAAGNYEEERKWILKSTTTWGNHVMDIFGSTVTVYGEENLPDHGPVVFVGNHQGYADIFSYFKAFQKFQFAFVAKKELGEIPLYGKWIARIRSVFTKEMIRAHRWKPSTVGSNTSRKGFPWLYSRKEPAVKDPIPESSRKVR